MLQKNTVTTATLDLLNQIMTDEFFSEFILVGGTALALPIKALTFFNDINFQEPIVMMNNQKLNWKVIEKRLLEMQRKPDQLFSPL